MGLLQILSWITATIILVINKSEVKLSAIPGILIAAGLLVHILTNFGSLLYVRNHIVDLKTM